MAHFQGPQHEHFYINKNEIAWKKSVTVLVTFVKDLPLLIITQNANSFIYFRPYFERYAFSNVSNIFSKESSEGFFVVGNNFL